MNLVIVPERRRLINLRLVEPNQVDDRDHQSKKNIPNEAHGVRVY